MAGIILSADIGTSSLKAAFIDMDGKLLAFSRAAYSKPFEQRSSRHGSLCATAWERAFAATLECLYDKAPDTQVDGICISGNGPTLVPVTYEGEDMLPLYWYDGKTLPPRTQSFFLPRAAWLKKNDFPLYEKTKFFISSHEWLTSRLGAEPKTVIPSEVYKPYYWDDEQCRLFDLDMEKFPPFIKMGEIMGHVSREAAGFFSPYTGNRLKSGTPIVAGGPDFITALIGTGVRKPGDVCDRAGSLPFCAQAWMWWAYS